MNENYFPRKLLCQAVGRGARPFGARTIMRTAMTLTHRPITLTDQMAMTLTERPLVTLYPEGGEGKGRRRNHPLRWGESGDFREWHFREWPLCLLSSENLLAELQGGVDRGEEVKIAWCRSSSRPWSVDRDSSTGAMVARRSPEATSTVRSSLMSGG